MRMRYALLVASTLSCVYAQQTYSPADIDAGGRLYGGNCANCHGATGDSVAGVDLGHGKFRRATTDDDLAAIITKGIPGTAMPPSNFSPAQARTIVAYLRSKALAAGAFGGGGDAARGQAIFNRSGCLNCHRLQGKGGWIGPDLGNIGTLRKPPEIERSLLDPNAEILAENRTLHAVTRDGAAITGRILSNDTFALQIIDGKGQLVSLDKASLREYSFDKTSPMPSFQGKLNSQELADLVSYLSSLKGL
jgi:cytochrome c oxidase cbb3-type subunit 3